MNEKLEAAISMLVERLEKTEKFVLDQAPSVCQEIIADNMIEWVTALAQQLLGGLMLLIVIGVSASHFIGFERDDFAHDWPIICGVVSMAGLIILSFCCIYTLSRIYFIKSCPKLILLREFSRLLKK